ncbi:MAG: hypothetical protein ACREQO_08575 [Candidatus Binatia bacterium]
MDSQTLLVILITVAVCALIASGVWFYFSRVKSRRLQQRFGPEYDRVVDQLKDRQMAETELENRQKRVEKYTIVPLSSQDQSSYRQAWVAIQSRFVDDPHQAVEEGDKLIFEVMDKRGYPVRGFEQAATDLSVDYPTVVSHYRAAAVIAKRNRTGESETEELRQGLVHFRALFQELVEAPPAATKRQEPISTRKGNEFKLPRFKNARRGGLRS